MQRIKEMLETGDSQSSGYATFVCGRSYRGMVFSSEVYRNLSTQATCTLAAGGNNWVTLKSKETKRGRKRSLSEEGWPRAREPAKTRMPPN